MPEIYIQRQTDDGGTEYVAVENWEEIELPEDAVRKSPVYKQVLDESIDRRKKLSTLKQERDNLRKQIDSSSVTEDDDEENPQPTDNNKTGLTFTSEDELFTFIENRFAQKRDAEAQAKQQRTALINQLIAQHKLGSDTVPILETSTDPETTAKYLGQKKFRFDTTDGGDVPKPTVETLMEKVNANLGLTE